MPADFLDLGTVNDDLGLGHPDRQCAADVPPWHGVAVLAVGDQPLDVDHTVDHRPDVIGLRRQRNQVGHFLLMQLRRRLAELPQFADVGDIGQPPGGDLIEMIQRLEGPAVEQAGLDVEEWPLHFSFGLRPPGPAGDRSETVVGGEGQEPRVVNRHVILVAGHHDFHIIMQACCGHTAQMGEGARVLAQGGRQILGLDESQILAARVAQDVAEQRDAAAALGGEVDVMDGVVHLGLGSRRRLEADHGSRRRPGTQFGEPLADHGIAAGESPLPQFLEQPHGSQFGIASQQFLDDRLVRVEPPRPPPQTRSVGIAGSLGVDLGHDLADGVPRQSQVAGDLPDRGAGRPPADDLIALLFVHRYVALR
jgi:hypothetical protein